ncbi:MAG: response regulator [Thermoplasmata archaeon]|nr:response regulator [Thermoplasmata archaeon]
MPTAKVLIVEDSPVVRLAIRQALRNGGILENAIFEAATASEAIELFDREHPTVVFTDISLPLGNPTARSSSDGFFAFLASAPSPLDGGMEASRYMLNKDPTIRLIVCTGNPPDDPRVRELIKAGAFHVLEKPLRAAEVRTVLERLRAES